MLRRIYRRVASVWARHSVRHRDWFATLGTIGFEGRFDYAAFGTVSNVASRLCDEAKPGQILISPRVLMKVENAVEVEPVGEFELKGIRRPLAAYNVIALSFKHSIQRATSMGRAAAVCQSARRAPACAQRSPAPRRCLHALLARWASSS